MKWYLQGDVAGPLKMYPVDCVPVAYFNCAISTGRPVPDPKKLMRDLNFNEQGTNLASLFCTLGKYFDIVSHGSWDHNWLRNKGISRRLKKSYLLSVDRFHYHLNQSGRTIFINCNNHAWMIRTHPKKVSVVNQTEGEVKRIDKGDVMGLFRNQVDWVVVR